MIGLSIAGIVVALTIILTTLALTGVIFNNKAPPGMSLGNYNLL